MKLSIVIVNYNVQYFLEQCLAAVYKSEVDFAYEVWVVDNHSSDDSLKMLAQKFPMVQVIDNAQNVGFSRANNQAIKMAKGAYVLLLNPDTIIQEDTLQKCVHKMDSDVTIGGLGVKMVDGAGHFLPESKRGFPSPMAAFSKMTGLAKLFPSSTLFGQYHLTYLDKNKTHEVDVLSGAFMLLRTSVLEQIGLLDEAYFMYGEDIDLSFRIRKAGFKNIYFADTSIIHFKGESTKKGSLNYIKTFYKAMLIFCDKHIGGANGAVLKIVLHVAIYMRAFLAVIQKIVQPFGLPLLDVSSMTGVLYGLHIFWEKVVKVSEHTLFPSTFFYVNIPLYVVIWIISMLAFGVYKNGNKWKNLWSSLLAGTIFIAVCYAFFPNSLRTSRGIIVLGFLINCSLLSFYRCLYLWQKNSLMTYFKNEKRFIIIANLEQAENVATQLQHTDSNYHYIGFITLNSIEKSASWLGNLEHLHDIIESYQPTEILFSTETISTQVMIETMASIRTPMVFKLITKNKTIISSSSKNASGEITTLDINITPATSWLDRWKQWSK